MTSLRDRCQKICAQMQRDAMLRQNSPVETLMAFVIAEKGRAADASLEESLPRSRALAREIARKLRDRSAGEFVYSDAGAVQIIAAALDAAEARGRQEIIAGRDRPKDRD